MVLRENKFRHWFLLGHDTQAARFIPFCHFAAIDAKCAESCTCLLFDSGVNAMPENE